MGREVPKDAVRRLLDTLPDEASYEDIQYHIYVQQKIDCGLEASERGDFISDEEIERRIARWAGESRGPLPGGTTWRSRPDSSLVTRGATHVFYSAKRRPPRNPFSSSRDAGGPVLREATNAGGSGSSATPTP